MNYDELINAGMDVEDFLSRIMKNAALVKMFVKKFTEDKTYSMLKAAVDGGADIKALEEISHTLKGVCGNLSLRALFTLLTEQVRLLREGNLSGAIALMPSIDSEYKNAIEHMNVWLAQQA